MGSEMCIRDRIGADAFFAILGVACGGVRTAMPYRACVQAVCGTGAGAAGAAGRGADVCGAVLCAARARFPLLGGRRDACAGALLYARATSRALPGIMVGEDKAKDLSAVEVRCTWPGNATTVRDEPGDDAAAVG